MDNEELKQKKITEIMKAEKMAVLEDSFGESGFFVKMTEHDEEGFLRLRLSTPGGRSSESFCIPYSSDSMKIVNFAREIQIRKEETECQEGFDGLTKNSEMSGFWMFGKNELERILGNGKISEKSLYDGNWNSYRYIDEGALENLPLKSVALPENLAGIGDRAFRNSSLREIWFPDTTERIGREAFAHCENLRLASLPKNAVVMENAFKGCRIRNAKSGGFFVHGGIAYGNGNALYIADRTISSVKIEEGTKRISEGAFKDERKMTKAVIPEGVREIGKDAFRNCTKLSRIEFSKSITIIGAGAFQSCGRIRTLNLPEKLLGIGIRTFEGCGNLRKVTAHEGLSFIKREAFANCTSLKTLNLPENIDEIDESAFEGCTKLRKATRIRNC